MGGGSFIKPPDLIAENTENTQITLNQEHLGGETMAVEWTDEKHSLYIKSMEASFVNNLYNSFDLLNYQIKNPQDPKFSRRKHTASSTASGEFKVLQHGCWEKMNFERNRSKSVKVEESGVLFTNPWIRHFRSNLHDKVALAADVSSYDSVEVTDQNFVDEEDIEEDISHTSNPKKIKIEKSINPITINDQVVPLTKFSELADVKKP